MTLNRYPYNNGHVLIVPYTHVPSQEDLETPALIDLTITVNKMLHVLREAYDPPGFNLGSNIGQVAGAGIAEHYHFHIVPRWPGDANFMTSIGGTRVIPDTLDNMYHELSAIWNRLYGVSDT